MTETNKQFPEGSLASADDQHRMFADDFVSMYSNNVIVSLSQWDVAVTFGEIAGRGPDGKAVVAQKLRVNMTKELAKVFKFLLQAHLDAYEKQFGEIRIPEMKLLSAEVVNESLQEAQGNKPQKTSKTKKG